MPNGPTDESTQTSVDWTTLRGLDLHLEPDPAGPEHGRRAGLEAALRSAVRTGRLAPDARLPSSRALSADLGVARGTVTQAYEQLVAEGYLTARHGSGTRVAALPTWSPHTADRAEGGPPHRWSLEPGQPDVAAFPRAAWLTSTRRVLAEAPHEAFGYGDARGRPELRRALASYLGRVRGVVTSPEQVVVCAGYSQALSVLARVLADAGIDRLAFENPSFHRHRAIAAACGLATPGVPVDADGIVVERITAPAVVVTPAHQFPSGVTLHAERRAALADWAVRTDGLVVEDDYDGEFRYDRQPVGAL
ncbi:MAG: aminotransferase class I/II-fold pyridoxal phosphate-dependent enzyme, partial [Propionibacteriales bacterium]|nr:aminotransferase class I/II-fold pyridoxal phosphate-dependent enzyme [Propionibacteriales bacterium]